MVRDKFASFGFATLVCFTLVPAAALAQSVTGVVKDATGAVLPGVLVEAASPVLIEKVRSVVTDNQGQYRILDLRPGVYTVTFSVGGFNTVIREGIELPTHFTATIDVELRVGAVEETVTVSGQSPLVDVQNVTQQRVVTSDTIDALPTGKSLQNFASLIPGMVMTGGNRPSAQDVGGLSGDRTFMVIHGGRSSDLQYQLDGSQYNTLNGAGSSSGYQPDPEEVQEFAYEVGAMSAEVEKGGVRLNIIPKPGGNIFSGTIGGDYSSYSLQTDNLTDDLRARGLTVGNRVDKIWDLNPAVGGPIRRDKLWFFASYRYWGLNDRVAGLFYNSDIKSVVYKPDLTRQAIDDTWNTHEGLRLTWQVNQKNKLSLYASDGHRCQCHVSITSILSPEAAQHQENPLIHLGQATWTSPMTSRLLIEAGVLLNSQTFNYIPQAEVSPDILSITELSTNFTYRANTGYTANQNHINTYRANLAYVTGSHAAKLGFIFRHGERNTYQSTQGDINLQLLNGVPRSITVRATPLYFDEKLDANLGLFAQDQWKLKRLTINAGIRLDYLNASVPAQQEAAVRFLPARNFAEVPNVPNWKDTSPRLGLAYDLFGTGRTAVKVTLSRYVAGQAVDLARNVNPVQTSVNSATRTWNDLNGDFYPNCDLLNPAANAECGALNPGTFGQVRVTTLYDNAVLTGWGSRGFNWETTASLQHELMSRISLNAAYFRRTYGNFTVTDNLAVTPSNYDPYCVTVPVDPRLPNGGGNQLCGLYDINPSKFGQVNNLVTFSDSYGKQWEHYNGVDLSMNARLPRGAVVSAGMNVGRSETDRCFTIDSPQELQFCNVKQPLQTQIKIQGTQDLPWNVQVSGVFQALPAPPLTATYVVTNDQIRGTLGRNLSSGASGTATIELINPGATDTGERLYQVDARLSKGFGAGKYRIKARIDLYNVLNVSPTLVFNTRYGPAWQQPTYLLPGRMIKLGASVDF